MIAYIVSGGANLPTWLVYTLSAALLGVSVYGLILLWTTRNDE